MVRYLSSALGKPFQFFSRWTLEEIENKYNVTREAMHLEALEEQQVETEDVALVQRKRKRDQIEEQVTTEGNPEIGMEKTKETVVNSEQQVVQATEKKEEVAEKTVEKEVEVPKQIEAQPSKAIRKKSVAKKPKMSKEVEEPSNISMWIYFENNQMDYFKVFRSDGTNEVFANHLGIFRKLSKGDLKKMYEIACTKEVEDFEEARMLVEDLKMMFAFSKTKAELKEKGKRDQDDSIGEGKVISWNTYENRVFSVNFEKGRMSFFLMDKRYDFEPIMMGSMLEVKKKAENLSEFDKELIGRLREQSDELKQKKVTGCGVDQNLKYVVQFDDGSEICDAEWENILDECTRENLKEMYEQRCTVIKVAVNDRDDPDQAKKRKFALECLFWLFEPFRLLGVKNSTCEFVKEWRWFEKCRVYSLNINDREMEYYFEECETDALDIQRLQCMMKVSLSTKGEPTRAARLLVKKMHTYLTIRLTNLAPHAEKLILLITTAGCKSVTTAAEDWRLPLPITIAGSEVNTAGVNLWQQAGRFGRREQPSLAIYVAFEGPLDQYFMKYPQKLFRGPIECCHVDAKNPQNNILIIGIGIPCLYRFVLTGISNMVYSDFESASTLLPQGIVLRNAHFDLIDDTIIMAQFVNIKTSYRRYDYNGQGKTYLVKNLDLSTKVALCEIVENPMIWVACIDTNI
ncbi:hypothetical protein OSB04_003401 [Centaurea solstitialis]|uniref:Uncharacterized protein n=1 Tax=Centaurea solstitialis TaxID=347529 RepID=A0AA38TUS7_9ASTR|nr:hypothetical protein OSB04_003401 [Centaurea solstitialis]